jgi:hypothetical protein
VLVIGDVNGTIACGLVAVKIGIRLVHVEAGLRSFDREMPEEVNRVLTDSISDLLFCSEQSGVENLRREGIPDSKVHFVGNVMIDTLMRHRERAEQSKILEELDITDGPYAVLTLHRPSNVDDPDVLAGILDALEVVQADMPVIFPAHPRTRDMLGRGDFAQRTARNRNFRMIDPLGYLDFLRLMARARVVLTDSGGIQEEDHHPERSVSDTAREHGAPGDRRVGHESDRGARSGADRRRVSPRNGRGGRTGLRSAAMGRRSRRADRGGLAEAVVVEGISPGTHLGLREIKRVASSRTGEVEMVIPSSAECILDIRRKNAGGS